MAVSNVPAILCTAISQSLASNENKVSLNSLEGKIVFVSLLFCFLICVWFILAELITIWRKK